MNTTTAAPQNTQRSAKKTAAPKVDIYESENEIVLFVEMPGVDDSSVDITLEEHLLTIKGESHVPELEGYEAFRVETSFPNYERTFKVHEQIETEQIEAILNDGVLTLRLPKAQKARPKKITVQKR